MFNIPSAVPLPTMRPDLYPQGQQAPQQMPMMPQMPQPMGQPMQAQAPGMMNRLRDNSDLLLAIGAGLLGGQTGPEQWAGGIGGAAQAMQGRKAQKEKNRTLEFLRQSYPEVAQMVDAGMPVDQAFKMVQEQRQAMMPDYSFQKLDDGTYGAFDANSGQFNAMGQAQVPQGFRRATPEEASTFGAAGGQFGPDGRFYPINPPSGMVVESDGSGGVRVVQGAGVQNRPMTEAQSKDTVYATRARGALPTVNQTSNALANPVDRAMDMDPTGVVRGNFQSPEYQVARTAGDEFLQAILRKDTGAAITEQEQTLYGRTYLPVPGDQPEVLEYKRVARERAVAAIEAGMSPAQMVAQERALAQDMGIDLEAGRAAPQATQRYRFNPATGELE